MSASFNHLKVIGVSIFVAASMMIFLVPSSAIATSSSGQSQPSTPFSPDIFSKQFTGNPISQPNSPEKPQNQSTTNSSVTTNSTEQALLQRQVTAAQALNGALGQQAIRGNSSQAEPQQSSACGQKIFKNTTLTSDITCNGSALIAAASGITINLNGYTITGPGITKHNPSTSKGIGITNKADVRILGPGIIRGFDKAVAITGGKGSSVAGVILVLDNSGVSLASTNSTILYGNLIMDNKAGISSQSSHSGNVTGNIITGNSMKGISLSDSGGFLIDNNVLNQNADSGIILDSQSANNTLSRNALVSNNVDINNAFGLLPSVNNNSFVDNNCITSNPNGLCFGR